MTSEATIRKQAREKHASAVARSSSVQACCDPGLRCCDPILLLWAGCIAGALEDGQYPKIKPQGRACCGPACCR
jgi:hypothetical protein